MSMNSEQEASEIETRSDLAAYLGVNPAHLTYVLYKLSRADAYRVHLIPKSNGGSRVIHAVSGPLRSYQKIALDHLKEDFRPSAYAHGFTPEKSIFTNAYIHRNQRIVLRIDIADFFPSINFGRVLGMFQAPPFNFGGEAATAMAQLACLEEPGCGLPQGGVLSPYIANMICRRLDARLAGLAKKWKCRFTRYADDIVFSTNDTKRVNTERLVEEISLILSDEGFVVNDDKTRVMTRSERQMVTGVVVNDGINVNRRYYRSLRALLHNWKEHGITSQLVRTNKFKDPRNPRPNIGISDALFTKNSAEIDTQGAELTFARHVFGRINFLLHATTFVPPADGGKWNNEKASVIDADRENRRAQLAKQPRARAAQRLLIRFHELARRNPNLKEVTKAAFKRINQYPELKNELSFVQRRESFRREALEKYRESEFCRTLTNRIDEAQGSLEQLNGLIGDLAKGDARFVQVLTVANAEKLAEKGRKVATYPPLEIGAAADLLAQLRNSQEGLGRIVHDNNQTSMAEVHSMLENAFDPIFYKLNKELRGEFQRLESALEGVAIREGIDASINWFADPRTRDFVQMFKANTRFGVGSSPLADTVKSVLRSTEAESEACAITIENNLKNNTTFYTHVPSVKKALKEIFSSLVKHCPKGDVIKVSLASSSGFWELRIVSAISSVLPCAATRDFANGKLNGAASRLNGLCHYKFTASFTDGPHAIDMLYGTVEPIEECPSDGVTHSLFFPRV